MLTSISDFRVATICECSAARRVCVHTAVMFCCEGFNFEASGIMEGKY